jgi:hypothetical protein
MRIQRRGFAVMTTLFLPLLLAGVAYGNDRDDASYRWDLINRTVSNGVGTVSAGGHASALANDGSMITVTGSGTFTIGDDDDVTGGGTWETMSAPAADGSTTVTGMGNYRVVALVRFTVAPGIQTTGTIDTIGDGTLTDNRAGLAFLRIRYDDGSRGILAVSCDLPGNGPNHIGGAPESIFEGITASKGYTDYWNRVAPVATVNANRTLFHILKRERED